VSIPASIASRAMTVGIPDSKPFLMINLSYDKKKKNLRIREKERRKKDIKIKT
jgi:hypothetical protein